MRELARRLTMAGLEVETIAVSYQAPDRTLTDTEVAEAREDILAHLRETVRAELRR